MSRLDIGLIHRSIWAIAMDIKDGKSSLSQNYKSIRMLTDSAVIILLELILINKYTLIYISSVLDYSN